MQHHCGMTMWIHFTERKKKGELAWSATLCLPPPPLPQPYHLPPKNFACYLFFLFAPLHYFSTACAQWDNQVHLQGIKRKLSNWYLSLITASYCAIVFYTEDLHHSCCQGILHQCWSASKWTGILTGAIYLKVCQTRKKCLLHNKEKHQPTSNWQYGTFWCYFNCCHYCSFNVAIITIITTLTVSIMDWSACHIWFLAFHLTNKQQ